MSTLDLDIAAAGPNWCRKPYEIGNRGRKGLVVSSYLAQTILTSLPLIVADVMSLAASAILARSALYFLAEGYSYFADLWVIVLLLAIAFVLVNLFLGLYPGVGLHPIVEFRQLTISTSLLFCVFTVANLLAFRPLADCLFLAGAGVLVVVATPVLRSAARHLASRCPWWGLPAIVFGTGAVATETYQSLKSSPSLGLRPVSLVDETVADLSGKVVSTDRLDAEAIAGSAGRGRVYWAIVTMPGRSRQATLRVIEKVLLNRYPHILIVSDMRQLPSLWNSARDCGGIGAIGLEDRLLLPLPPLAKRMMDLVLAVVGGLLVLPLAGLICLLIKISSPGPIFYGQRRIGQQGRPFRAWKFRTMVSDADKVLQSHLQSSPVLRDEWKQNHKLKNDPRITWIGRWLRKSSLDELPQLWNVLLGQMSLVGPRPIVEAEIKKYGDTFQRYVKVRPGVTGLWQISGRNNTTYDERVRLDAYYVRNWSPWFDLYILLRTVKVVLLREGAY